MMINNIFIAKQLEQTDVLVLLNNSKKTTPKTSTECFVLAKSLRKKHTPSMSVVINTTSFKSFKLMLEEELNKSENNIEDL